MKLQSSPKQNMSALLTYTREFLKLSKNDVKMVLRGGFHEYCELLQIAFAVVNKIPLLQLKFGLLTGLLDFWAFAPRTRSLNRKTSVKEYNTR